MSKKKLVTIIATIFVVIIVVSVAFVVKNKNTDEKETTTETIAVEETTVADTEKEATTVVETNTTEKEKLTIEKTTINRVIYAPDKNRDVYKFLYKKEHIVGVEIRLWGTYLEDVKGSDPIVRFSADYETTTNGEDEYGTYTDYLTEGYSYYFDLKTKVGYREDWSVFRSEYDESGDIRLLGDGFPEKQEDYDAVEIKYEKDCVVLTLKFDKPLQYKNVDAEFNVYVGENIFGTEMGIGNFVFQDTSWTYADGE